MQENLYFSATENYGQKRRKKRLFDVTMGSFDGVEICELVGLFILNHLGKRFGKENTGLYRDDGSAIIKSKSARLLDKTRKELHKIFEQFDLKITAEVNLNIVKFLDVTFDMNNAKHKPYRKPNDDPLYINRHSNHPPSITRQLPTAISTNASHFSHRTNKHLRNLRLFTRTPLGIVTLITNLRTLRTRRNRQRNIIWFNPPFSRTNYAKHAIVNKGVKIWNSLDKEISSIMFYCTFKKKSKIFFL